MASQRQPASSPPDVLAATPQDLAALLARAALKLDPIRSIVLAWPELLLAGEQPAMLDTLLAELRDVPRIVLSWNPSALGDFLERHARRAEVVVPREAVNLRAMVTRNLHRAIRRTGVHHDDLLRQVAHKLCKPRNQWPVDELLDRLVSALNNAAMVDRRLKELPPACRQILPISQVFSNSFPQPRYGILGPPRHQ